MSGLEMFSQGLVLFITLFVMAIGLIFTVVPPLPGTVLMWAAAVFYGLALGWDRLGWWAFGLLTFFAVAGIVVDFLAGHFGAKLGGASCLAVGVGALLGLVFGIMASLVGTPVLGCFAGLAGMVVSILLIEWRRNRNWETAMNATKGYVAGTAAGIMAKVTSGVFMFVIFLARVYWGG